MNFTIRTYCLKSLFLTKKQLYSTSSSQLTPIQQHSPKSLSKTSLHDTIFIRHAHSQFNKACQDYRIKHKIDYDWQALRTHKGFDQAVAYNPMYIDCPLTEKGIQQCYLTSHNLNLREIDVILVSPHNRALQTCRNILKYSSSALGKKSGKIPVIVEPLIAGSLWSSCDVSDRIQKKLIQYPDFDFSKVSSLPDLWYTSNLKPTDKKKIQQLIKHKKITEYQDKQRLVLQLLQTSQITESRDVLRQRTYMIKNELKRLKEKHCNFLVISHYYVIQYINSRAFGPLDHKPIDDVDLKNCCPYYNNLEKLLSYK